MNLFIDTTNWNLVILLEQNNKIVDQVIERDTKKVSDFFMDKVFELLKKHRLTIKDIENLYVLTGPGSYTGVRVGLMFVKTLKTIDNKYQTYVMNSLQFQAGTSSTISVLDARGQKFYVGVYENSQPVITEQVVDQENLKQLIDQYQFKIVQDYAQLDFAKNFLELKQFFSKIDNYENLQPIYLKKAI